MEKKDNIVLVTGASGFVGHHLVQYLSNKGQQVRALYHNNAPNEDLRQLPNVTWLKCDLLDVYDVEDAVADVTDVYHCAAIVSFSKADRDKLMHFNIESTKNLVNEALEQSVRKVVSVSSIASLGRSVDDKLITEEQPWEESKYNSIYARSKYRAELEVWRGVGEGMEAAVVNPGIILGEGDWNAGSAKLVQTVYDEFPYYTSGINAWVDVKDVVRSMFVLMNSDISGERYVISHGNHSYKDIFTDLAHAMNRKPPHKKAGKFLSGIVWRLSVLKAMITGKPSTITKETARTAQRIAMYDNSKFIKQFPSFNYTPLNESLQRIGAAYLASKK